MSAASLAELLVEYDRARAYTRDLWSDLSEDEVRWRPHANSSAIGWHLGHQPAVAHFMVRNLTAAEASLDASSAPAPRGDAPRALPDELGAGHELACPAQRRACGSSTGTGR